VTVGCVVAAGGVEGLDGPGQGVGAGGFPDQGGEQGGVIGALADALDVGTEQQDRFVVETGILAQLAGKGHAAAVGQVQVDDEEVVGIGVGRAEGAGLFEADDVVGG